MTSHTPGPWEARCEGFKGWTVSQPSHYEKPIAVIYSRDEDYGIDGGRYHDKECAANARLIAAAPDLLEACRKVEAISAEMKANGREATFGLRLYEAVKDALAKTGAPSSEELQGAGKDGT